MPAIACDARVNRASVATSATMIARPGGLQIERVCFSVRAGRRYWISTASELTYKGLLLPRMLSRLELRAPTTHC